MPMQSFYPNIGTLVTISSFPEELQFLEIGLQNALSKIYYKEFQYVKSNDGAQGYYNIVLITGEQLKLDLFSSGFSVVINPGDAGETLIPLTLNYNWPILALINSFNLENFSYLPADLQNIFNQTLSLEDSDLIQTLIQIFEENETIDSYQSFVDKINQHYNLSGSNEIPYPDDGDSLEMADSIRQSIEENSVITDSIQKITNQIYILSSDNSIYKSNLDQLSQNISGESIQDYIKKIIIPKIEAELALSLGLSFPRNILVPVDSSGNIIPEPEQSILIFDAGILEFSTQDGINFQEEMSVSLNHPSQIGNTGLGIDIEKVKLDLSQNKNIIEADLDGRPQNFMGVYAQYVAITLPSKWFNNVDNTTLQIAGYNMLIGTGGISGTVGLEAINTGNPVGEADFLWVNLGKDPEKSWKLGFNSFDLTFKQNDVVSSNIKARLEIPTFKDDEGDSAVIDVVGHLGSNGDFLLTASAVPPFNPTITFPNVFKLHLNSIELGKEGEDFFIGATAELEFLDFLGELLDGQTISISALRIYSDGHIDFRVNGGNLTLPKPVTLKIGPTELSVTAIHFGSSEREKGGKIRKYNYFGFDGGISIGIAGVDARGDGIKYYYTIDDDPSQDKAHDSYLHIQTIYVDMVIPANSSDPSVAIKGWLTIPEPGDPVQEYQGGVDVKIKTPRTNGKVDMRLAPRYPAFLIDAAIELPNPIALGPVSIYGFRGLLGYRYVAEKKAIGLTEQNSWYEYYKAPVKGVNVKKFSRPDQTEHYSLPFSLGVGVIVGDTMAMGNIVSANAMLLLSLPSMIMIDARLKLLAKRVSFGDDPPFFGYVIFGDSTFEFGFGADYKFPEKSGEIIKLYAEIQASFPFKNMSAWYINFGTEEQPISAKLLMDIFTLQAYLMLSGKGIKAGARGEFRFDRKYGPVSIFVLAYLELGGRISFQKPQMGAYFEAGIVVDINVKIIRFYIAVSILLAVESPKPFLIYGAFNLEFRIKIFLFKLKFKVKVELKWEFNKVVDRTPVNPFTEITSQEEELVKGVSMLTNETFDLVKLNPNAINVNAINKVIPLDTYIDIKATKGLLPGAGISNIIGGYSNPAGLYTDLIPPEKVMKGLELRQVKHQYSIENIEIKAYSELTGQWKDYNPYVALYPGDAESFKNLKVGQWQKKDDQYNAVRMLATTPFSYTEQGIPGWYIPESYGIMSSTLFCEGQKIENSVSDFLDKPLNTVYYASSNNFFHSKEVSYQLQGEVWYDVNSDGSATMQGDYAAVSNAANVFGFTKSLEFPSKTPLVIMLPAPSVDIALKLSTRSSGLKIGFYAMEPDSPVYDPQYITLYEVYKTKEELNVPVKYPDFDTLNGVTKIVITPDSCEGTKEESYEVACKIYPDLISYFNNAFNQEYPYYTSDPDPEALKEAYAEFIKNNLGNYVSVSDILKNSGISSALFENNKNDYASYLDKLAIYIQEKPEDYDGIINQFEILKAKYGQILDWLKDVRPCQDQVLCDLAEYLSHQAYGIFRDKSPIPDSRPMLDVYMLFISQNPAYRYLNNILKRQIDYIQSIGSWYIHLNNAGTFNAACDDLIAIISDLGNCIQNKKCTTLFHEISWLTVEDYTYNIYIPQQDAINEDIQATMDGIAKSVQPIWRPDTRYYVKFRLKDQVDNGNGQGIFEYAYGFRTAGPLGFFHLDKQSDYGDLPVPNTTHILEDTTGIIRDQNWNTIDQATPHPDLYPHTSLRAYIDYERSYPNADGNTVNAKPLFYDDETTEIRLYFNTSYVQKLLEGWESIKDNNGNSVFPELGGTMKIMIKDPVEGTEIINPPRLDVIEDDIDIPQTTEYWEPDDNPPVPWVYSQYFNLLLNSTCVGDDIELVKPKSNYRVIIPKKLKPQKLYTVQVLNFYWGTEDFDIQNIQQEDKVKYAKEVHQFVFQTSRYKDFEQQIMSCFIPYEDENGNSQEKQAVYTVEKAMETDKISAAMDVVKGISNPLSEQIALQYSDPFDRIMEGLFGISPLEEAVTTEFNKIIDTNTGKTIALLIRNPEPFNHPKIPADQISRNAEIPGMIEVLNPSKHFGEEPTINTNYYFLYSKDYAKAIVMNDEQIQNSELNFQFIYKIWNGTEYEESSRVIVNNITINP